MGAGLSREPGEGPLPGPVCISARLCGNLNSDVPSSPSEPVPSWARGLSLIVVEGPGAWDSDLCRGQGGGGHEQAGRGFQLNPSLGSRLLLKIWAACLVTSVTRQHLPQGHGESGKKSSTIEKTNGGKSKQKPSLVSLRAGYVESGGRSWRPSESTS